MGAYLATHSAQVKHALLFLAGLFWFGLALTLFIRDGKPHD